MSAFFGIFGRDGAPVDKQVLTGMAVAMRRRGPDAEQFWTHGDVGVGHRAMWATPEALYENPPLVSSDGNRVLSADVRLDNREQLLGVLRPHLTAAQKPAGEIGDHELLLAAYEKWGTECARHLLGDFAFVLWDGTNHTMFCARDHFGSKPFHYFLSDQMFVCASEVKGILAVADVPKRINEPRIADFLVEELEGIDKTSTFYQDIFRMPPATTMVVDHSSMRQARYWQPEPGEPLTLKNQEEYTEAFLEVFTRAVACRLRSHKPPASTLSGGIDSSAIVAVGRDLRIQQGLEPLHTISALSDTPGGCIESQAALAVINQGYVIAHCITPSGIARFRAELEDFVDDCDDPFSLPHIGVPLAVYCLAKEAGVNVVLDGIDGDLVTSHGSHYLAYLLKAGCWKMAFAEARSHSRYFYRDTISPLNLLVRNARTAFIPHEIRELLHRRRARQHLASSLAASIINRQFAREMDVAGRLQTLDFRIRQPLASSIRAGQARLLDEAFITVALERYDRQASSQSVEARHPFFDVRLVEFCLALPWHQRIQDGYSKAIVRRSMAGKLPEFVRWRVGGWEHLSNLFNPASEAILGARLRQAALQQNRLLKRYIEPDILERELQPIEQEGRTKAFDSNIQEIGTLATWVARRN